MSAGTTRGRERPTPERFRRATCTALLTAAALGMLAGCGGVTAGPESDPPVPRPGSSGVLTRGDLERTHEELVKQELELLAEAEQLEVLDDIERWALRKRGLDRPATEDVVIVRVDQSQPSALLARQSGGATDDTPR